MRFVFQDMDYPFFGVWTDLLDPEDHPCGSPIQAFLMSFGHVFFESGEGALAVASGVAVHPAVFEEHFRGLGG